MEKLITINALVFYALAVAGVAVHVIVRWSNGNIQGTLGSWWTSNKRASVSAILLIVGSIITMIVGNVLSNYHDLAQVIAAFGTGYVFDSSVNKQAKPDALLN